MFSENIYVQLLKSNMERQIACYAPLNYMNKEKKLRIVPGGSC